MNETIPSAPYPEEDSIDLLAIAKTLWGGRKTILICMTVAFVLGILIAFSTPNTFTAKTVMVPQMGKSSTSSSLSSLASLAGFDLSSMNQSSTELSPLIYPQIVNSVPFKLELMNTPFHFSDLDSAVSMYDYYINYKKKSVLGQVKKYTLGLPGVILKAIKGEEKPLVFPKGIQKRLASLTKDQLVIKKLLDEKLQLSVEKKEGYLTLTTTLEDPVVAAELTQKAQELLQDYITQFKVEKSQAELNFIQERYNIAQAQAEGYQYKAAASTDLYKDLVSNIPKVSNDRLQTKYSIANSVYLELAKQLEQAKIQVKRDTPTFTIVEPTAIPSEKSGPSRVKMLAIWLFLGGMIGCGLIYAKQWFKGIKEKWDDK